MATTPSSPAMPSSPKHKPAQKGSAFQPKGTMPKDKIAKFKLTTPDYNLFPINPVRYEVNLSRNEKSVRDFVRKFSTYRMLVHKVGTHKLPVSMKYSAHYFSLPLSKGDSSYTNTNNTASA